MAVLRLSGPDAWLIASQVFSTWPETPTPRLAIYGTFANGDDGLALPFEKGHSYTGDQSVELSCHGSRPSIASLLNACIALGARMARPGEFTERAFLNGRLDLTQAEAVRDTVEAQSSAQLKMANFQRDGSLRRAVEEARSTLVALLGAVEATVDFEEEIGPFNAGEAIDKLGNVLHQLLEDYKKGARIPRQGLRVAILGRPNAGKSCLLNALAGFDRSIVTGTPGTTRDFVEETVEIRGLPCILIDTAGLRETCDEAESLGVTRTRRIAESADVALYLFDSAAGWTEEDEKEACGLPEGTLFVANKIDAVQSRPANAIPISALHCVGLDELQDKIAEAAPDVSTATFLWSDRYMSLFSEATSALESAIETLRANRPLDLISVELSQAIHALGQITGETASPEMLDLIFRDFCIGK